MSTAYGERNYTTANLSYDDQLHLFTASQCAGQADFGSKEFRLVLPKLVYNAVNSWKGVRPALCPQVTLWSLLSARPQTVR